MDVGLFAFWNMKELNTLLSDFERRSNTNKSWIDGQIKSMKAVELKQQEAELNERKAMEAAARTQKMRSRPSVGSSHDYPHTTLSSPRASNSLLGSV